MRDYIRALPNYNIVKECLLDKRMDPIINITDLICWFAAFGFQRGMLFMCLNLGPKFVQRDTHKCVKGRIYAVIESVTDLGMRIGFLSCTSSVSVNEERPPLAYNGWKFYKWSEFVLPTNDFFQLKALPIPYAPKGIYDFTKCGQDYDDYTNVHGMRLMPTCLKTGWYVHNVLEYFYEFGCKYTGFSQGRIITSFNDGDVRFFVIHKVKKRRNRKKTKKEQKNKEGKRMVLRTPMFDVFRVPGTMLSQDQIRSCTVMNMEEFTVQCTILTLQQVADS